MTLLVKLLKLFVFRAGKFKGLYVDFCRLDGAEYAQFLSKWGGFYSIGEGSSIYPWTILQTPLIQVEYFYG